MTDFLCPKKTGLFGSKLDTAAAMANIVEEFAALPSLAGSIGHFSASSHWLP